MGYPNYWPGRVPVADCETRKGLSHFLVGLYLSVAMMLISGLLMALLSNALGSYDYTYDESGFMNSMGPIIILALCGIVLLALAIVALVFFILGLVEVYKGRAEFGPAHESSVKKALVFLLVMFVIYICSTAFTFIMGFSAMSYSNYDFSTVQTRFTTLALVSGILGIVSAAFQYLFLVFLVKDLMEPERRKMPWAGFSLGMISPIFSLALIMASFRIYYYPEEIGAFILVSAIPAIITLLAMVIFIVCFREVVERIDSGELEPVPPPPFYPGYQVPPPPAWNQ
jgi:MFS family permease